MSVYTLAHSYTLLWDHISRKDYTRSVHNIPLVLADNPSGYCAHSAPSDHDRYRETIVWYEQIPSTYIRIYNDGSQNIHTPPKDNTYWSQ